MPSSAGSGSGRWSHCHVLDMEGGGTPIIETAEPTASVIVRDKSVSLNTPGDGQNGSLSASAYLIASSSASARPSAHAAARPRL